MLPAASQLVWYQWSRKGAPAPKLAAPIDADDETISVNTPLRNESGAIVTGKAFLFGMRKSSGWTETALCPSHVLNYDAQSANFTVGSILTGGTSGAKALVVADSDSGTSGTLKLILISGTFQDNETITDAAGGSATSNGTLTSCISADGRTLSKVVRGIKPGGLDFTVGSSDFADSHDQDEPIFCSIPAFVAESLRSVLQGLIASGASNFIIGADESGTVTISRSTGVGTYVGFARWSSGNNKSEFSNNGTDWTAHDDVVASSLFKVSANDTTPSYLDTKTTAGDGISKQITSPGGDERLELSVDASDLVDGTAGLEASSNNFQVKTDSDSGLQFDVSGNLEAKLKSGGGLAKDSNGLYLEDNPVASLTFGEAIDGSSTPKLAFVSKGTSDSDATVVQEQKSYGSGGDRDVYGVNFESQTFTISTYEDTITAIELLLEEFGNPSGNFRMRLYAVDGSGKPTGSALATETLTATSIGTTNYRWKTFTLSSPLTVTPGTEYAIVVDVVSGDASNYVGWIHGSGNTYSGGQAWNSADAGSTWTSFANDFCFRVWSYETQTAGQVYQSHQGEPYRGAVDGFVTTNTAASATGTLVMGGRQDSFTGLTPGANYYSDTTAGGITASTGGLKIGKAVSATEIVVDKSNRFVVGNTVTTESLQIFSLSGEEEIFFNFGFEPEKVGLHLEMDLSASVAANSRQMVFTGEYSEGTLKGNYVIGRLTATDYCDVKSAQGTTSITITDGAAETFAFDTLAVTEAGFSCRFFSQQSTSGSAGQGIITATGYPK